VTANLTIKQESFCLAYIETGNGSEAYRLSYNAEKMKPASINRKATELLSNGTITARLEELREVIRKRHAVTVDSVTRQVEKIYAGAMEAQQFSAAKGALELTAKLHGLMIEKKEHSGKDGKPINPPQTVFILPAKMTPQEASEAYADTLNNE